MSGAPGRLTAALADRYRIERELGQGGMATVFLAADLRHDRKVAIKVLKPELAAVLGADRFVVEIKTTASLQHPHILPLFDSGVADGFLFYVMPFIEGETLRSKLDRETQLGIEEAVRIASNVADALDYAHRHGVIHRDIKPENILMHDGRPTVADFGIALALSAAAGGRMTETGLSLGTPHYMSPEQATAEKELTPRSDIYSLGCVLYEMLSGSPPHVGASAQQIIMKIVMEPAQPVTQLRKSVPPNVAAAVCKALEKLPADRFESAKAFADALANPGFTVAGTAAAPGMTGGQRGAGVSRRWFTGVAALAGVLLVAAALGWLRPSPLAPVRRLSVGFAPDQRLGSPADYRIALSPDGERLVYMGLPDGPGRAGPLWLRAWSELKATPLPGTEGGFNPSFSPDGKRVAFVGGTPRAVRVVSLAGGPPVALTDSLVDRGGLSWGYDGYIYYDGHLEGDGIARVREAGGKPERVTQPDTAAGEIYHVSPAPLPNGKGLIFIAVRRGAAVSENQIAVFDFKSGKHRVVVLGAAARYAASGHLLYVTSDGTLMAAPFDQDRMEITGAGVALAGGVSIRATSRVDLAVSDNGILVYTAGAGFAGNWELIWVSREGTATPIDPDFTGFLGTPRLSPDGRRVAVSRVDVTPYALWIKQLDRGPASKLAATSSRAAAWTADGKSVAFISPSASEIWTGPADASVLPALLRRDPGRVGGLEYTGDGEWLIFRSTADLFAVRTHGDTTRRDLVTSSSVEVYGTVSPNGRWLTYSSDESGRFEVYVRPFPDTRPAKHQISVTGGVEPRWSRDGRELFYVNARNELVAVPIVPGPGFSAGASKVLFSAEPYIRNGGDVGYDVGLDGTRFLMARPVGANRSNGDELILVENLFGELRTKVKQ